MKKIFVVGAIAAVTLATETETEAEQNGKSGCWKHTYGRGAGEVLTTCPAGKEKNGLLCYNTCPGGFYGVGPVCWQYCPAGFRDDGAFCAKPGSYGRGGGYVLWDWWRCVQDNPQGCEQYGLIHYPKCKAGFYAVGCCICSPYCQDGQADWGVSCAKQTRGRDAGSPMICRDGLQQDGALCYPYCKNGYTGVGPLCWQNCPTGFQECGALCVSSDSYCSAEVSGIVQNVIQLATSVASTIVGAATGGDLDIQGIVEGVGGTASSLAYPICDIRGLSEVAEDVDDEITNYIQDDEDDEDVEEHAEADFDEEDSD